MANRRDFDHIGNRKVRIEIEGVTQAACAKCSGIEITVEVVESQDGDTARTRKRPGRIHYSNIVLERGYTSSAELWQWVSEVLGGRTELKSGSAIMFDETGNEVTRYNFFEAWPCRWKGFEFDASGLGASIEELEITVEGIARA